MATTDMHVHETTFRASFKTNTRIFGLRATCPKGRDLESTPARIWIAPGGNLSVEASIGLWNQGLDPLLVCPERCEVSVTVTRPYAAVDIVLLTRDEE